MTTTICQLKWAIGENIDKAEGPDLQNSDEYEVHWLRIENVYAHACAGWAIDLSNCTPRQERNVERIEEHIQAGGWLDPSEVRRITEEGCIRFEGRHRLVVALKMGDTYAPFSIRKEHIEQLRTLLNEKNNNGKTNR